MKTKLMIRFLLSTLFISATLNAQNLLSNKSFDTDISSWDINSTNAHWINNDGAATSGNGSVQFGSNSNNNSSISIQSELVNVTEGYHYILGVSYKRPTPSLVETGYISIYWYDANDSFLGEYPHYGARPPFFISASDIWENEISEWDNIIAGAVKAKVVLWVNLLSSGTNLSSLRFDDVIFYQDTVFKSSFE